MIHKEIALYLSKISDDLSIVNKLLVEAYLQFNNIEVKRNKIILDCMQGNDKKEIDEFISLVRLKNKKFDFEDLIHLFETTIPLKDVSTNGAVYTPYYIKDFIVGESLKALSDSNYHDIKVADIACGTGAFLYTVSQKIRAKTEKSYFDIFKENIFGLDISDYTITRAKILLSLLAISNEEDEEEFEFNLIVGNALSFDWNNNFNDFQGFDIVLGNPPYVRAKNLSDETKLLMVNWDVTKSGNPDLYIPFFEIGLKYLKQDGILGYITVNTFKRSVNARNLREYFKTNLLDIKILDFGNKQVFQKKSTYTCIVFLKKKTSKIVKYQKINPEDICSNKINSYSEINYEKLDTKKGWVLNKPDILDKINKIEKTGVALGDKFLIKNGLATLSNDVFIFKPIDEDEEYFYHPNDKFHKIEKSICRDIIKPNRLKNESEIVALTEKIIFPYHGDDGKTFEEQYFIDNFPYTYAYLKEHKDQLLSRDKGKNKKYKWFEFGRTQALADIGKKLLFPYMAGQPYFIYTEQEDLLLYAGYAVYFDSERELKVLKCILESDIFWYYIKNTSKPYSGNYYALSKNYVKDFGICELTEIEKDFLLSNISLDKRNIFLSSKYGIDI